MDHPSMIELNPNRLLLNSNFDGYKLSLQEIPCQRKDLFKSLDRVFLSPKQYSLLHAKLFGFHNYLVGDPYDENDSVYFIDCEWNIYKTYIDPMCNELIDPIIIWSLPKVRERGAGDYNVSMRFISSSIGVIGDGTGILYIIDTGLRNNDDNFTVLFSGEVTGQDEPFLVIDASMRSSKDDIDELHVLLLNIQQDSTTEHFSTILHWIVFHKIDHNWRQDSIRQLKCSGYIDYAYLEQNCEHIYVVSDSESKIILNSDFPVGKSQQPETVDEFKKLYKWSQSDNEINIRIPLEDNVDEGLINVSSEKTEICIKYGEQILILGELYQKINSHMTTWTLKQNTLEIVLNKEETGTLWRTFLRGDQKGEYEMDTCIIGHERPTFHCKDTEALPPSGMTFNSQQVEECDFESDKSVTFERFSGSTNQVTHRVNLGTHQVLLKAQLHNDRAPAMGIRHDVDICLWQPEKNGDQFSIVHEGTLLALGYVQASKRNRKFIACPPDMSYSVICESSGHLFIYKKCIAVSSGEVRNRSTGRRVNNIAQQQVVNISNDEILGIYCTNTSLFILSEKEIRVLKIL
ncbi:unnamed protein product [Phaedon cochleariae]|uniref:NudC domain-containing protein 1 n=1 Tax=Phaedon cochleariae TaxID=80249 RepID=A0A9P0GS09_PHACE|nr:unnamed protein product [Phaedon cochleariae]